MVQFSKSQVSSSVPKQIYVPNVDYQPKQCPQQIESLLSSIKCSIENAEFQCKKRHNLNKQQQLLLKTIQNRSDIMVVATDKNLGPALLNRSHYIDLCLEHLNDKRFYKIIQAPSKPLLLQMRSAVRRYYKTLFQRHGHDENWHETKIITFQLDKSRMNRFYGLAKIHKPKLCIRPIISNSGSTFQGLSRWLDYKLQPYLKKTKTYLKDSDDLLNQLQKMDYHPSHQLITFDVESLYTNIPINQALQYISLMIKNDSWMLDIIEGLKIILTKNYFEFGDLNWLQLNGTAMGTAVAPAFASLYLAYVEEHILIPKFESFLVYYKRFIDDGFIIWNPSEDAFAFNRFLATFKLYTKLNFTWTQSSKEIAFLDVWILAATPRYQTRTHQKKLNLYLYLPANSAHPPGVLKGLIFSLVKKYHKQNSRPEDFRDIILKFYSRLQARGYSSKVLKPIFNSALHEVKVKGKKLKQVFFKIPFDPNGPNKVSLRKMLKFSQLQKLLQPFGIDKPTICYLKPPTLRRKLCPTTLSTVSSPTPAERLASKSNEATSSTAVGV